MAISGTMLYSDEGKPETPYLVEFHQTAKNISKKSILLFAVESRSRSDQDEAHNSYSTDFLFSAALDPEKDTDASILGPHYGPPHASNEIPRFSPNSKVTYVEFGDGTHWGDPATANTAYDVRHQTVNELHRLRQAYELGADTDFVKELMQAQNHWLPAIATLQQFYDSFGLEKTELKAWEMMDAADAHSSVRPLR